LDSWVRNIAAANFVDKETKLAKNPNLQATKKLPLSRFTLLCRSMTDIKWNTDKAT
jgi:hypothetical protein